MNDTATPPLPPPLDREQGIIAFNRRVLALAESPNAPLLERLRYITIVSSNLDELFEIRVAELKEIARSNTPLAATARTSIATLAVSTRGACTMARPGRRPKASRPSSSTAKLSVLLEMRGNGWAGSRAMGVSSGSISLMKT